MKIPSMPSKEVDSALRNAAESVLGEVSRCGEYFTSEEVLKELDDMLRDAETKAGT